MMSILVISVLIKLIYKKKIALAINKFPIEKKNRVLEYHYKILKIYKMLLWIAPLQLVITPYFVFKYASSYSTNLILINISLYAYVLADIYYKRSILKQCRPE